MPPTGPFQEVAAGDLGDFFLTPRKSWSDLYPGEYFTTRNNLECSVDLVLGV